MLKTLAEALRTQALTALTHNFVSCLCKQLNFLFLICSNETITENPCGPKKLNSDVPSYIWTLEPCRLDCSSRKVKRSGYLLDFIFGRHAKLSQCFFSLGWHNLWRKIITHKIGIRVGRFFYFSVSFPNKRRHLSGFYHSRVLEVSWLLEVAW